MARRVTRTLNLYALHGRLGDEPIDYRAYFAWLADQRARATTLPVTGDLNYAVEGARIVNGKFFARIVAGSPGEFPTFFDYRTGELLVGQTPTGQWLAKTARIVVDPAPDKRMLVLEMSRSGVNVVLLERYFSHLLEELTGQRARFDLPPIPAESLLDEIHSLERIREAAVVAARPNLDWDDTSNDLSELAAKSGGDEAEAVVRAGRGRSLSRREGVVRIITDSLRTQTPNVRDFRIVGRQPDASKDVTISSRKHQRRAFVDLDSRAPLASSDDVIRRAAEELIESASDSIASNRDNPDW